MNKFPPLSAKVPGLLHGADYNPEQWGNYPDVIEMDMQMMTEAHCNIMSVGIFSWSKLEPEEGIYQFDWLDGVLNKLFQQGIHVFLATPSGARPAWMSQKYPEVLRVGRDRVQALHGGRHNHCLSSPVYRRKVNEINQQLAQRYAQHPAVIGWHISNEYSGECHCSRCQSAFRQWVQQRYQTLERLNEAWWSDFWSHTYSDWSQIESPAPQGEVSIHGLNLDWRRFCSSQATDFCAQEIVPLKAANPLLPATTNFMEYFYDYDYWQMSKVIDFISWDSYPMWHNQQDETGLACYTAMFHDLMRSLKQGQPFVLMESTPSVTNWQPTSKLKKPGMHILSSLQAVAHGADSVQYFQWRKSRGSVEKFHGAVIDHSGRLDTRVGKEVCELGRLLAAMAPVAGSRVEARVAIIFDWESRWAMDDAQGPRNIGLHYEQTVVEHYRPFWEQGIAVDIINADSDLSGYQLVIAPMLYMVREGFAERAEAFVRQGGQWVASYWSGIVNESDLCYLGGFPGPLRPLLGIWAEEIDSLTEGETNSIRGVPGNELGLQGNYQARHLCELIHLEGASAQAVYGGDFYAGRPALTVNRFGEGKAWYVASRNDASFQRDFFMAIAEELALPRALATSLPQGVTAQRRTDGESEFVIVQNYSDNVKKLSLPAIYVDMADNQTQQGEMVLAPWGCRVLTRRLA
ncbi:Beta-galactosidase BglY [Serratia proteamaculans]|uniref:beta-galactosidase n=1 Tax=Serratia proteamaculans TaxID=28151 RepID=UPI001020F789|nr:beta-galactosidase [Serratia proteamaculans]KAB1498518.1 beta-galactosidase [Serratia proteamaculans]RYM52607.1 beta-galactosidase [Serratia proteamaculans]CAI0762978.1 Beta-galactosidase BglY [Serratia proteamaculans]CAI0806923.1 Beta-galactosidase BglY [Serratia proteamaculans]CAI2420546.1 Beta-galactosidase BglY [Serratia proteamaculans]